MCQGSKPDSVHPACLLHRLITPDLPGCHHWRCSHPDSIIIYSMTGLIMPAASGGGRAGTGTCARVHHWALPGRSPGPAGSARHCHPPEAVPHTSMLPISSASCCTAGCMAAPRSRSQCNTWPIVRPPISRALPICVSQVEIWYMHEFGEEEIYT